MAALTWGVLQRTARVWTSDCIDPVERQTIQTWTSMLVAPEYLGAHVGAPRAHTTRRTHDLTMRAATALIGHFGIEWDLRAASPDELDELARWVMVHKQWRDVISTGRLHHRSTAARVTTSMVSKRGDRALVIVAQLQTQHRYPAEPVTIPGLEPEQRYRVVPLDPHSEDAAQPAWTSREVVLSGQILDCIGVTPPTMFPETAWVLELHAV